MGSRLVQLGRGSARLRDAVDSRFLRPEMCAEETAPGLAVNNGLAVRREDGVEVVTGFLCEPPRLSRLQIQDHDVTQGLIIPRCVNEFLAVPRESGAEFEVIRLIG